MRSETLIKVIEVTECYLIKNYSSDELKIINTELKKINYTIDADKIQSKDVYSYEKIQAVLSSLNEKETIRKSKGVYYTPQDVVKFILINSIKNDCGKLKPNNFHVMDLNGVSYSSFCYDKTVYDPTCGVGVFLLAALEIKLDLLDLHYTSVTKGNIKRVISSIYGNDLNRDSIAITKIRLLICILNRYGVDKIKGLSEILNSNFESYNFITQSVDENKLYDIIIGNPPYVEDNKSEPVSIKKYGNIYANVLENASLHLKKNGVMGFIIPLSYIATPRMAKIRNVLFDKIPEQYILSYSDRPDCLFTSVHQKLCIIFGKKRDKEKTVYTSNYKYWYREERENLFYTVDVVKNHYFSENFIPKLGTKSDVKVYQKILEQPYALMQLLSGKRTSVYLNMRATFWIKAFLSEHTSAEYKTFSCQNDSMANLCICLLNSSLFWWFWISTSDCWHITKKELLEFKVPELIDHTTVNRLAKKLERKLEETKVFVGTKQTQYEYKHKECVNVIYEIDNYINNIYGLTVEEGLYIKNFAYRYRVGGGAIK